MNTDDSLRKFSLHIMEKKYLCMRSMRPDNISVFKGLPIILTDKIYIVALIYLALLKIGLYV
jgi:hypothetical protein